MDIEEPPGTNGLPIIVILASNGGEHIAVDAAASDFIGKRFALDISLIKIELYLN